MTMTDRELLERAAKAAGELTPSWYGNAAYFDGVMQRWNPLTDDGDALRLAVKLGMLLDCQSPVVEAVNDDASFLEASDDANGPGANKAMRRAIVRAAAALAKED